MLTGVDQTGSAPPRGTRPRSFRADIQGLRAVAVLIVVAGHAGVPFLTGGFVGVDVFFVISGFLITRLLVVEVQRSGRVSLRAFYARRARRILPAATLVLAVTVAASAIWLSALDALNVVTDALWAVFFAANLRFADVGTDYFAQEEAASPLQHYWSLAVEEQFYLVWPVLLLACAWLAGRRGPADGGFPRRGLLGVLAALILASLAYALLQTGSDPIAAYFSTPARAWELGVGAVLAVVGHRVGERLPTAARGVLTLAGLTAIGVACVAYDAGTAFPGAAALLPTLGAGAVLLSGIGSPDSAERSPWPVRVLAVRPLRVVGDWSYSLYLWHWPLLVIPGLALERSLTAYESVAAVTVALLLAGLTFHLVENPARSGARSGKRPHQRQRTVRRGLALYPASVLVVALISLAAHQYADSRLTGSGEPITVANSGIADAPGVIVSTDETIALVQASVFAARQHRPLPGELRPSLTELRGDVPDVGECDYVDDDVRRLCPRGVEDTGPDARTIVVLGNSHGRMWIPAFEQIADQGGYTTYYLVKPNCTAADLLVNELDDNETPWQECSDFREWALEQIEALQPDLTVVSTSGPNAIVYTDDGDTVNKRDPRRREVTEAGFAALFERLLPLTERLVLLRDIPKSERDAATCLTRAGVDLGTCLFTPVIDQEQDSADSMAAARRVGIEAIDPTPWLCWQDQCPLVIGDVLSYRDRGHLSARYAAILADDLGRRLGLWSQRD
ncbi:acyltransferase family protein [Nocardioides sp.]|uniref:acyltransferase family protein n=1 Tax=Nocardioides sp. TaxID=35761 RepID=UPI00260F2BFE|nr:acyltransferase family protein [Nocardioides sp.]